MFKMCWFFDILSAGSILGLSRGFESPPLRQFWLENPWAKMNEWFTPMRIALGEPNLAVCLKFLLRSRMRR